MTKKVIGIIEYGTGNIFSISKSLLDLDYDVIISRSPRVLMSCDGLILPGVGAFSRAKDELSDTGLDRLVLDYARTGKPLLGICVGMQLFLERSSEFGTHPGLGLIKGQVKKIDFSKDKKIKVPVIGWNKISFTSTVSSNRYHAGGMDRCFYFVHSYSAHCESDKNIAANYEIGSQKICAIIEQDNVTGVQFHPEKSDKSGKIFLKKIFG